MEPGLTTSACRKREAHPVIVWGRNEPARPGDQRYTSADTSKLYRHLGWEPRVSLDEGLDRQVQWQVQHAAGAAA